MKRVALLAVLAVVGVGSTSAASVRTLRGNGLTLSLPSGWHGLAGPAGFQAADFPLSRRARSSADLVRVPRGHVHLVVWNYGPWSVYLPHRRNARLPLLLRRRDGIRGIEGFGTHDALFLRTARIDGEQLEVIADLGPKPLDRRALRRANTVLATLHVLPPRVLRARNGRLASDGVSMRLLPRWSGRVEIPAGRYGARLVLRAARGDIHLELLEIAAAEPARHLQLPIVLTSRDTTRRSVLTFTHKVFSTGGRSFELEVTMGSTGELGEVNRFLATLSVAPRPWTFRSCELTLRLPGTWRVAVRPRSDCYPVLKLRGPGVLVALIELRPGEHASGRILRRAGRRFRVEVRPASARANADAVLSTMRAKPRS